jgi:hypothetical protein
MCAIHHVRIGLLLEAVLGQRTVMGTSSFIPGPASWGVP